MQNLLEELKYLNLGQKCPILVFSGWNLKIILPYLKSVPSNLSNCWVLCKKQKLNLEPEIPYLGVLSNNLKKILSYLKSEPSNWSCCKVWSKNKSPWIWGQKCLIWVFFGLEFENNIVTLETSTLEFVENEFLTHTVKFCVRTIFSKVPGYAFSEGLDPRLLYKVCPTKVNKIIFIRNKKNISFRFLWLW